MRISRLFLILSIYNISHAHNPAKENLTWKNYFRIGAVHSQFSNIGFSTYGRLKRTTNQTFRDIRLFGHFYKNDIEIRLRHKYSRHFLSFDKFYSFNTLTYQKNTMLNVNLRYHLNQGIGWLIKNNEFGNMTLEVGIAFDNSDYLNNQQKATFLRGGFSIDKKIRSLSGKFEIDYFHQLNQKPLNPSESRIQFLGELSWKINGSLGIISGITSDINENQSSSSIFLTASFTKPLDWKF
ncbi:MAG: DUF481 domain-containing protein [Candidatus Neomarinimicrobiota bacterium]